MADLPVFDDDLEVAAPDAQDGANANDVAASMHGYGSGADRS